MGQIHVERTIAASPERVFDWLLDPVNLTALLCFARPVGLRTRRVPASERAGTDWIGFWAHEQITVYDAPRSYSYIVVGSFPPSQHNGGMLMCTPSGDGTHVDWVSGYTLPARAGCKVVELLTCR